MKPTVGQLLWYYPHTARATDLPYRAAIIARVWDDHRVNLMAIGCTAEPFGVTGVTLLEEGEEHPTTHSFATWPERDDMLVPGSSVIKTLPEPHAAGGFDDTGGDLGQSQTQCRETRRSPSRAWNGFTHGEHQR